jgi:transposase
VIYLKIMQMGLIRFYPGYKQDVTAENSVVCMEATGVYGQALAYFLVTHKYRVSVEPPLKVKRAFPTHGHKNDITDSENLAAYLGICPYEHSSGKSVYRRPRSRRNGREYKKTSIPGCYVSKNT